MQRLLVVVGPTASGKTTLSVQLAKRLGGEIVSGDSMQVYRGMDIGTAKIRLEETGGVRHHLINLLEPDHPFSAAEFQALADQAIGEIAARGRLPMLVGGTGLYVKAVTDGYDFSPAESDPEFRQALFEEAETRGTQALHGRLSQVDPEASARLHPNDLRRIIRALEVYHETGKKISEHGRDRAPRYDLLIFGLTMPREELYGRINRRVRQMIDQGWAEEAAALLRKGYRTDLTSMQALGYRELITHLKGEISLDQAIELISRNTRRFAKRQLTWFRADPRIHWIDVGEARGKEEPLMEILQLVEVKWK